MIALDTSVLIAIMLDEPEAETFKTVLRQEPTIVIGWPTLFETRTVLAAKRFSKPGEIVALLGQDPAGGGIALVHQRPNLGVDQLVRVGTGIHPARLRAKI